MSDVPTIRIDRSITRGLRRFDADRFRWLDEAAAMGPLVGLAMGPITMWVVTDSRLARTMLVTDGGSWTRPPAARVPIRMGVGENLFTQTDRAWAMVQPALAPAFRTRAFAARLARMDELIDDDVRSLPYDTPIDLELATGGIALRLAAWVLFGEELTRDRAEEIATHQRAIVIWVGERLGEMTGVLPFRGVRGRVLREPRAALDAYADEVLVRARTRPGAEDDVLSALTRARPGGKPMTAAQLRGHILGLFLAGNETTAAALVWMLVHGAQSPSEWAALRLGEPPTTSAYITESLRLAPAVWGVLRTPTKPGIMLTAAGVSTRVRRGQVAIAYLRGIHRDMRHWPDPLRFDPARHARRAVDDTRALIPFGLGPRSCIGQHLAMAELTAVVPALAQHGDVRIDGSAVEDPSFALRVRGGLRGSFARARS